MAYCFSTHLREENECANGFAKQGASLDYLHEIQSDYPPQSVLLLKFKSTGFGTKFPLGLFFFPFD